MLRLLLRLVYRGPWLPRWAVQSKAPAFLLCGGKAHWLERLGDAGLAQCLFGYGFAEYLDRCALMLGWEGWRGR